MIRCHVCFRHCDLNEGDLGFCGARICHSESIAPANYGRITSLALDPVEGARSARTVRFHGVKR